MKTLPQEYYTMLFQLQCIDFVLVELNLYLDTHPGDRQAVEQYNTHTQLRRQMQLEFETRFGPLMHFGHSPSDVPWQWAEGPWPWEV